jgi:hypothetical protein
MLSMGLAVCLPAQLVSGAIDASSTGVADEGLPSVSSESALTKDRIAVYRAFIGTYASDVTEPMNLGNRTIPLELPDADRRGVCLKGIALPDLNPLRSLSRPLSSEVANRSNVRLVDPERQTSTVKTNDPSRKIRDGESLEDALKGAFASGLLQVSEIAFDRNHRYAVMRWFSFLCGMLCGHGGTMCSRSERVNGSRLSVVAAFGCREAFDLSSRTLGGAAHIIPADGATRLVKTTAQSVNSSGPSVPR